MVPRKQMSMPVLEPDLQVSFYYRLQSIRQLYLHEALRDTVQNVTVKEIDQELAQHVGESALRKTASFGLRGEVVFAVPCLLRANPYLLGYYRLLLGLSQKEFYSKGPFGSFKRMEESGEVSPTAAARLPALSASLIGSAEILVEKMNNLSLAAFHELQILTLGPQLRGSENTRLGQRATIEVYDLIKAIVRPRIKEATKRTIIIENASKRTVLIEFASDPDVRIVENLPTGVRPLVSIEVKGGTDFSNIHNRLGEAEKSHQKARNRGFFVFWTIVRVDVDPVMARRESPTTSHFFHLDRIAKAGSPEAKQFRDQLCATVGIRG